MAAQSVHLVDELEAAFQTCFANLTNQEHFNINETEEVRTGVEQGVQKFLDIAKQLESYFLHKRLLLSAHKPEQLIKEDIDELKHEIELKDKLLQKHQAKLLQWQNMLNGIQGRRGLTGQQASSTGQPAAPPQGQSPHVTGAAATPPVPQPVSSGPSQAAYPQGPLAYLEQTTSNIGMPERR